ncbi:MAG: methyltransferase [Planctomycetota bacterium]
MTLIDGIVLGAYVSLLIEQTVWFTPSVASTAQLVAGREDAVPGAALARAKTRSVRVKLLAFVLPAAVALVLYAVPLVAVFWRPVLDYLGPLPILDAAAVRWGGVAAVVVGRAVTMVAITQVRAAHGVRLHTSGLYARCRHPALLGLFVFYLGACLVYPCVALFAAFVPYVLHMHGRVLLEESFLEAHFGDEFRAYRDATPRYL